MRLIRVLYRDGKYDMMKSSCLDLAITNNKIKKFYRMIDQIWVDVDLDKDKIRHNTFTINFKELGLKERRVQGA